jgi:hypothetical protein
VEWRWRSVVQYLKQNQMSFQSFDTKHTRKETNRHNILNIFEVLDSLMGCDLGNICTKAER